eukprot:CAMPEP_0195523432 /NCGR_PEP_ID=MMETSP0794_2-20130614/22619_1 /TAXON_ID=515487 /ORGANISM="Stephanopyxis turris, Strain CCMP 815" /LENGTH=1279 /DNA_ID=CAMNT_0040653435 /DNA_START=162 /DNA_END=4001 /DNA_ORIENTATION=-
MPEVHSRHPTFSPDSVSSTPAHLASATHVSSGATSGSSFAEEEVQPKPPSRQKTLVHTRSSEGDFVGPVDSLLDGVEAIEVPSPSGHETKRQSGSQLTSAEQSLHFEAAHLISRQLHMNLPILEQFRRSVDIMNQERSCADPSCRMCRWPRSTTVTVNPCTGAVKCKAMQRKFRENVRIAHFNSILRHITIMLGCVYVLLCGFVYWAMATKSHLFFETDEMDFSVYPTIAVVIVTVCCALTVVTLVFLWCVAVQGCTAEYWKQRLPHKSFQKLQTLKSTTSRLGKALSKKMSKFTRKRSRRSRFVSAMETELTLQEKLYSCTHIGLSPIVLVLVLICFVAFSTSMFFIQMGLFQIERKFLFTLFNATTLVLDDCVAACLQGSVECNALHNITLLDFGGENATLNASFVQLVQESCESAVALDAPWNVFVPDSDDSYNHHGVDGDEEDDSDDDDDDHQSGASRMDVVIVDMMENLNEVNMFVILLFGKFCALFLMVVNHIEFHYVLAGALSIDVIAVMVGFFSISHEYVEFLMQTTFLLWVIVFFVASVPMFFTFGILQKRAMQQFVVMYASAEDNLRFQRPNIVHDCLHVDSSKKGKIGAGSSGQVFKGRYAGFKVAVKELYSAQMDNNMEESFQEAETLARLRHPNIVTFYGIGYSSEEQDPGSDSSGKRFQIITELCSISLDRLLSNPAFKLDERKLCAIGLQIAYGMQYLHSIHLEHYDMKPENVLIKKRVRANTPAKHIHVKIADFGLARLVPMSSRTTPSTPLRRGAREAGWEDIRPAAGTFEYMPPEILRFEENRHLREVMQRRHPTIKFTPAYAGSDFGSRLGHRHSDSDSHRAAYALQNELYGGAVLLRRSSGFTGSNGYNNVYAGATPQNTARQRSEQSSDVASSKSADHADTAGSHNAKPVADAIIPYKWDVYSFGVVLWQMHTHKLPFSDYLTKPAKQLKTAPTVRSNGFQNVAQQPLANNRNEESKSGGRTPSLESILVLPQSLSSTVPSRDSGGSVDSFATPTHRKTVSAGQLQLTHLNLGDTRPEQRTGATDAFVGVPVKNAHPILVKEQQAFRKRLSRRLDYRIVSAHAKTRDTEENTLDIIGAPDDLNSIEEVEMLNMIRMCTAVGPWARPGFNDICSKLEDISRMVVLKCARKAKIAAANSARHEQEHKMVPSTHRRVSFGHSQRAQTTPSAKVMPLSQVNTRSASDVPITTFGSRDSSNIALARARSAVLSTRGGEMSPSQFAEALTLGSWDEDDDHPAVRPAGSTTHRHGRQHSHRRVSQ